MDVGGGCTAFQARHSPILTFLWRMIMTLETKFLRLPHPVPLGHMIDDEWRVCWIGGWDKYRILFVVMAVRKCQR